MFEPYYTFSLPLCVEIGRNNPLSGPINKRLLHSQSNDLFMAFFNFPNTKRKMNLGSAQQLPYCYCRIDL